MRTLERTERMMVRWMCGKTLKDKCRTEELRGRLGIEGVADVMRRSRLRWFGHEERKMGEDWVKACRNIEVEGKAGRGRNSKTWMEGVNDDMKKCGLRREWAMDRELWRRCMVRDRPTHVNMEKRTLRR